MHHDALPHRKSLGLVGVEQPGRAAPFTRAASFQPRLTASCIPRFRPGPAHRGVHMRGVTNAAESVRLDNVRPAGSSSRRGGATRAGPASSANPAARRHPASGADSPVVHRVSSGPSALPGVQPYSMVPSNGRSCSSGKTMTLPLSNLLCRRASGRSPASRSRDPARELFGKVDMSDAAHDRRCVAGKADTRALAHGAAPTVGAHQIGGVQTVCPLSRRHRHRDCVAPGLRAVSS